MQANQQVFINTGALVLQSQLILKIRYKYWTSDRSEVIKTLIIKLINSVYCNAMNARKLSQTYCNSKQERNASQTKQVALQTRRDSKFVVNDNSKTYDKLLQLKEFAEKSKKN